jgi:hypothetical protein
VAERVREHPPGHEGDGFRPLRRPARRGCLLPNAADRLLKALRPPSLHRSLAPLIQDMRAVKCDGRQPRKGADLFVKYFIFFNTTVFLKILTVIL